jgi:hypothetical protein
MSGVTGTGTTTGATYRYEEGEHRPVQPGLRRHDAKRGRRGATLVGSGGAGASTTTLIVVWRLDADGLKVDREQPRITCSA